MRVVSQGSCRGIKLGVRVENCARIKRTRMLRRFELIFFGTGSSSIMRCGRVTEIFIMSREKLELLELGEAVGTQSRGLSQDQIALLPTSKFKCGLFFIKKSRSARVFNLGSTSMQLWAAASRQL